MNECLEKKTEMKLEKEKNERLKGIMSKMRYKTIIKAES